MRTATLFLLPLLCGAASAPANFDSLIASAQSVPGEFAADALIRIASAPTVEKAKKIELLEVAFERASGAEQPYKRRSALLRPDGQAGYWTRIFKQDLDGLTLRVRAVSAMLPLDAARARGLFARIPEIKLPRVKCEDYLVYDVSRFYDVLAALAASDPEPAKLLGRYAGAISSPEQVAPMAGVLAGAKVSDAEFQSLVGAFAKALSRIGGDDRSFTNAQTAPAAIQALTEEAKRRKVSPLPLLEGYRVYLVMNLSAVRCADNDLMDGGATSFGMFSGSPSEQAGPGFVTFFNSKLLMKPLEPIAETDATPSRLEGVMHGLRFCEDEECRGLGDKFRPLLLKANGVPYTTAERNSPEWQAVFRGLLSEVSAWKPAAGMPPEEVYEARTDAYRQLLAAALDPSDRELAMRGLLDLAASSPLQKSSRLEWFLPLNGLIGRMGIDPLGWAALGEEAAKTQNAVIALYAALEAAVPRTADFLMPLL